MHVSSPLSLSSFSVSVFVLLFVCLSVCLSCFPSPLPPSLSPVYSVVLVQKYSLMGVRDSYTDFHVDFGGTSVWYHFLRGQKIFYLIPPTEENLIRYQDWVMSSDQSEMFFGDIVPQCYICTVNQGNTLFIPTGSLHIYMYTFTCTVHVHACMCIFECTCTCKYVYMYNTIILYILMIIYSYMYLCMYM